VIRPGRDEHREAWADRRGNAIENRLARAFLHAKELVELVDLRPDLLLGLQCHDDELAVLCRVQHAAELFTLDGDALDVFHETFHDDTSLVGLLLPDIAEIFCADRRPPLAHLLM